MTDTPTSSTQQNTKPGTLIGGAATRPSMDTSLLLVLAVAVSAVVTFLVTRSVWARRLDEARLAAATELAAARQDNKWLQQEVERQQQSVDATHALLASAGQNLRDAFQSLAADALHANRGAFMDMAKATLDGYRQDAAAQLEARQKAVDGLVQPLADTLRKVESRLGDVEQIGRAHV